MLGAKPINFGVITLKIGVFIKLKINQIEVQIINIWWHSKEGGQFKAGGGNLNKNV